MKREIFENTIDWIKDHLHIILFAICSVIIIFAVAWAIHQAATQPKEGVVVRKDYKSAYTTTSFTTIHNSNGTTTRVPIQQYHEATYQIVIKGINSKGEEDLGYYNVTPIEYENIKIGDYYIKQMK